MIGEKILNYEIEKVIGEGGMGIVYLGKNVKINQHVAIKMLTSTNVKKDDFKARFQKEATTLAALDHSNIVKLNNYIENEKGLFLIMEYVEGVRLDDYIRTISATSLEDEVVKVFDEILKAFAYAHECGIVHRDIKPSNILITSDGNVKILDFGIAKLVNESDDRKLTKTGVKLGTLTYMSPEQVKGISVDKRSDIYSLGVLMHHLLTKKTPYDENTMTDYDITQNIVNKKLPRVKAENKEISRKFQHIIDKATAKEPKLRFQSCEDFRIALTPKKKEIGESSPKSSRKKIIILSSVALVLLLVGAFLVNRHLTHKEYAKEYNEGVAFLKDAQYEDAKESFEKAQELIETDSVKTKIEAVRLMVSGLNDYYSANYEDAFFTFEKAEKLNSADANYYLGELTCNGMGTEQDYEAGKEYTDQAIELGYEMAYWRLGYYYNYGVGGVDKDEEKANEYYLKSLEPIKRLADLGDPEAQGNLASMYDNGTGIAQNEDLAFSWYLKAAKNDYAFMQTQLAFFYMNEGEKQDYGEAHKWLKKSADAGDARGQYYLGYLYQSGEIGKANYNKAKEWYEKSADQGNASAIYGLGVLYYLGKGDIIEDDEKARELFEKAAAKGHPESLKKLGDIYFNGYGLTKDVNEALSYYKKAIDNGSVDAMKKMGGIYRSGDEVDIDIDQAIAYYTLATLEGNTDAIYTMADIFYNKETDEGYKEAVNLYKILAKLPDCYENASAKNMLGVMYYSGLGVEKDEHEAIKWLQLAADEGHTKAAENLEYIRLNPNQQ